MTVIIGIDPHKASHTAVAIGCDERQLAEIKVRATCRQTAQLLAWAEPLGERTWAVESAGGLGYLLSQQALASKAPSNGSTRRRRSRARHRPEQRQLQPTRRPAHRHRKKHGETPPPSPYSDNATGSN
jgi:hypothetical protein